MARFYIITLVLVSNLIFAQVNKTKVANLNQRIYNSILTKITNKKFKETKAAINLLSFSSVMHLYLKEKSGKKISKKWKFVNKYKKQMKSIEKDLGKLIKILPSYKEKYASGGFFHDGHGKMATKEKQINKCVKHIVQKLNSSEFAALRKTIQKQNNYKTLAKKLKNAAQNTGGGGFGMIGSTEKDNNYDDVWDPDLW